MLFICRCVGCERDACCITSDSCEMDEFQLKHAVWFMRNESCAHGQHYFFVYRFGTIRFYKRGSSFHILCMSLHEDGATYVVPRLLVPHMWFHLVSCHLYAPFLPSGISARWMHCTLLPRFGDKGQSTHGVNHGGMNLMCLFMQSNGVSRRICSKWSMCTCFLSYFGVVWAEDKWVLPWVKGRFSKSTKWRCQITMGTGICIEYPYPMNEHYLSKSWAQSCRMYILKRLR